MHVHIHETPYVQRIYVYAAIEISSDALKTKEAITLPPNDFEKNERLYANEMEEKENKNSRMYL